MGSNKGRWFLTSRFLLALLAPAAIAAVMQVTWPFFEHNPISPFLLAVIFSWYGGLGPALVSMAISFLHTDFYFVEPFAFFWFPKQVDMVRLLLVAVVGSFISVIIERMHKGGVLSATSEVLRS
jgi:K+-sensing histidine kinase KdpD